MHPALHATAAALGIAAMSTPALAAARLTVTADAPDALIVEGAPRTVTVAVTGDAGVYELRQRFINRYREETAGETLTLDPAGGWRRQVEVPVEFYGPATYRATLVKAGEDEPVAEAEQMLIRPVPVPRLSAEARMDSPIGTNTHAGAHWQTLAALGIHWARDYSWGWLGHAETAPVASNKTDFAKTYAGAEKAGITLLPILQQAFRTPDKKFFIDDTETISRAYEKLSNTFPEIPFWELDNEADLVHRDDTSDDFRKWFQSYLAYIPAADRGLDAAGEGAQVVLNGEAGIHPERTQELIDKVGEHFAVVNYHYYSGTVAPELAINDINTGSEKRQQSIPFLDRMRQINRVAHAAGKQAWLTEIGWSARRGPAVGDRLQSAYLQRIYLLAEWAGTDKTFWFWDRDLPGEGRFSSTGLIHQAEESKGETPKGVLPAGAAMAGVSKFIAQADYAGSVDLGDDRWCLVFRRPEGGFTVAAWSVTSEYDLPSPLAGVQEAFGMYGNPLRDRRLTAEPAYFQLAELPGGWAPQLEVEWLSPRIINLHQGGGSDLEAQLPDGAAVTWENLPEGTKADAWQGGRSTLRAAPQLAPGTYQVAAVVEGDGWRKRFPLTLKVRPALAVEADSYTAGTPAAVTLTNMIEDEVTVELSGDRGRAEPASLTLAPGASATARFTAADDASEPVVLQWSLGNGGGGEAVLRPRDLVVPRVESLALDGDLSDWPDGGTLTPAYLKLEGPAEDFAPRMKLAWSPRGLHVAAEIPVGEGFKSPAAPQSFWEWTSVEMNLHAADAGATPDDTQRHLFWFTPVKADDGDWRIYAGEWQKPVPGGEPKTINDDDRMETAARYDGQTVTVETLIPAEVLGQAPQAGQAWRLSISSKLAEALSPRTVASWPGSTTRGPEGWGRIRFVE